MQQVSHPSLRKKKSGGPYTRVFDKRWTPYYSLQQKMDPILQTSTISGES